MSYYRVVFRQNQLLSCIATAQGAFVYENDLVYESEETKLTFALVKATDDKEAIQKAEKIINEQKNG